PAAAPLVVGETVVYRGPDRLTAVSAKDGALRWTGTPVDFTYRELVEKTEFSSRDEMTRELYLGQRSWRDETSSALSTDGTLVYTVMDCGMLGVVDPGSPFEAGGRHGKGSFRDNSLQAYALRGGRQRWSIGGPITPEVDPFGGLFFLGPPLPHEGVLYSLVEDRGQVRLLALRPRAEGVPELLWSQSLLNPSPWMNIENHEGRRTAALQPVARGDVLICPTGAGSVVAVDLFERRLLWGTSYQDDIAAVRQPFRRPTRMQPSLIERQQIALDRLLDAGRWRDHSVNWVGDYVLVPTPDADNLSCLRASDGKSLWTVPRENWLYLAGCALDHVVLVGANQIGALWLENGESVWQTETPIPTPCGRGVEHDGLYTLPVATGELITVDLRTGQLLARSSVPEARRLGNLAFAGGRLVSQSASSVVGYAARDASEDWLAAIEQPDTAQAGLLTTTGESLLHAGQFARGVAALRLAIDKTDNPRARQLLAAVLTERLRSDFSHYRNDAEEIERLVTGTATELEFHRLMASESQRAADSPATFRHLLQITRLVGAGQPLEAMEDGYSVTLDRWVAGQLRLLLATSTEVDRAMLMDRLRDELQVSTAADGQSDALSRLVPLLRGTSLQSEVELAWARVLPSDSDPAIRMQAWLDVLDHPEESQQAEATVRLAELCLECHDPTLAAVYVEKLRTDYADEPTVDGRTGTEWLVAWEQQQRLGEVLSQMRPTGWPVGELDVRATGADVATPQFHAIPVRGVVTGPLAGWTFAYHDQKQQISAHTPLGEFAWETPVVIERMQQQSIPEEITIQGPLVMVSWADRVQILSAITREGGRFRPVRLTRNHQSNLADFNPMFQQRGGMERVGTSGPLTRDVLCYHQGATLIGLDPWTGRDVWRRTEHGVSELLGDEDYVVVRSSRQNELQVLRAVDGVFVSKHIAPEDALTPPDGADWGRGSITIASQDDDTDLLGLFDPVTGEHAWQRELQSPLYWTTVDGGTLLVIDGEWTCRLIDPATGNELAQAAMPGEPPTERLLLPITAFADSQHIFFVLNEPVDLATQHVQQQNFFSRTVNGRLCAWSKSSGEIVWSQQIESLFLNPRQPPEWPVLVLAARQKTPDDDHFSTVQVAIDKQSGEFLLEDRQSAEGLRNEVSRRMAWRVQGEGPTIRINHDLRSLVIRPKPHEEPTE
ncbi:MAG: PQQ-binding-like beta-propeller repeat protein, partial [Planctomycetaceae bacterium]